MQHLRQLPGCVQQIQLRLLPRIVGVQKSQPLVIFLDVRGLQVFQAAASLVKLRLQDAHILLCELQLQPRHFPAQFRLSH